MVRADKRFLGPILLACCLLLGCGQLKEWAYEGFNRDQWQQPEKVIAALQIRPGDQVADLGAGGGYFTFKLAKAVGAVGKVYAVDIDREMTDLIAKRAKQESLQNVESIVATPTDPMLPKSGVDLIFTSNTYHHIENRGAYFTSLRAYLKPGGKVAIIDFDERAWFESFLSHYTPSEVIIREMDKAGYSLQKAHDFLDRQSFLVFTVKP
jgi:ubiquinone/menaquinone biosynthesis C-methylase UbiE